MSTVATTIAIKDVIRHLDQPRRQIFIEALILEVQLDQGARPRHAAARRSAGRQRRRARARRRPDPDAEVAQLRVARLAHRPHRRSRRAADELADVPRHEHPVVRGPVPGAREQDNTNILSAPHVIAIDNEKAEFSVGNNIPYKAGLSFGGFGLPAAGATGARALPGSMVRTSSARS